MTTRTRSNVGYAFGGYVSVSRAYATNGLNQYQTAGPASFTYDSNGNLTSDGTTGYTYDAENRLVGTTAGATLTYDATGRLFSTYRASTGTTTFLYDGDALVGEYDAGGNTTARYVHGTGEDDPIVWYKGATLNSPRSLQADQQGTIIAVADATASTVVINSYDEYGIPATTNAGRFQYTGQAWLPELGMYYYKARIYSPTLGRFLQIDPIGYRDQVNLYAYVANDPVNKIDPNGQEIVIVGSPEYRQQVLRDVRTIQSRTNGNALVHGLIASHRQVVIRAQSDQIKVDGTPNNGRLLTVSDRASSQNGTGSDSTIYYNPNQTTGGVDINGSNRRPAFVGLGHELGQAETNARGDHTGSYPRPPIPGTTPNIEQNAIFRENQIRAEHGITPRTTFTPPSGCKQGPGQCQ